MPTSMARQDTVQCRLACGPPVRLAAGQAAVPVPAHQPLQLTVGEVVAAAPRPNRNHPAPKQLRDLTGQGYGPRKCRCPARN
jgi:hypothetical protein